MWDKVTLVEVVIPDSLEGSLPISRMGGHNRGDGSEERILRPSL